MKIIATIGAAGSGKSTWIQKFAKDNNIPLVNPDAMRAEFGTSESDQSVNGTVFSVVPQRLENLLKSDGIVAYDATCVDEKNRKIVYDVARKLKAEIEWHWFGDVPIDVLIKRQEMRSRKVPDFVIRSQVSRLSKPSFGNIVKH